MKRRAYLHTLAASGALGVSSSGVAQSSETKTLRQATGDDSHHPGPPRFTQVGEPFYDGMYLDFDNDDIGGKDRDNFAPRISGTPQRDPSNYAAGDFSWSIKRAPSGSSAALEYAPPDGAASNPVPQYDAGRHNAVEFAPDQPGTYVLELDAPDGTHEQTIYAFPSPSGSGGPPRISIDGHYDADAGEFVLESNPRLAPDSPKGVSDLYVKWLADDRDALATGDVQHGSGTDSWVARIPKAALNGETARVHAAPSDGNIHGMTDTVVLDPDAEAVAYPNRPPEWIENGVMYEIFTRSFGGPPPAGEWPLENSRADFANFTDRLDYLEELGVDVVWFTPVVPSESANWRSQEYKRQLDQGLNPPLRFKYSGGGPHGYDTLSYFQIAEDLASGYSIDDYYDDPATRQAARQQALQEYKQFVQEAHDRGIKVCLDFVINHCGRHHEFFQDTIARKGPRPSGYTYRSVEQWADGTDGTTRSKYFDWFDRQDAPLTDGNGTVVEEAPANTGFAGLRVMPNLNYGNVALREHILAAADFWSGEVGVDAFRCDIAYGVVHSFWKEVREIVRANDSEFMLLDEVIPNDPSFAENEFDMHFDTGDFMTAAHAVVEGDAAMQDLYGAVAKRATEGFPEHTLITNATENHDEFRALDLALDAGARPDPAKAQRAVWAAGVVLPGVPFVYYGQERQISKYGTERYNFDGTGEDPRDNDGDVGPGNPSRAYMNWAEYGDTVPEDHQAFYEDLLAYYHEDDLLKPGADLLPARTANPFGDILAFRRQDGEEARVVLVNASEGTGYVDVHASVTTRNRLTGEDVQVGDVQATPEGFDRVGFDTVAVLDAPPAYDVAVTDAADDDVGPGDYRYPTDTDYAQDALDIAAFRAQDAGRRTRFEVEISGGIDNPWNYQHGFSAQHLQVYLRDPDAGGGSTTGRTGTNLGFAEPYHYRVVVDGRDGVRVEAADGTALGTGSVTVDGDTLHVAFDTDLVGTGLRDLEIAPLLFGYQPSSPGNVLPVASDPGYRALGGADNANAPRAVDVITPPGTTQAAALEYSASAKATVPFLSVAESHRTIRSFDDPSGDDTARYDYPTGTDFQHGAFDLTGLSVAEGHSTYRFEATFDVERVRNPFGLPKGFSHQFLQFYLRDPSGSGPSTTAAWDGLGATLEAPYRYRLVVNGQYDRRLEAPDGSGGFTVVTREVNVSVDGDTIAVDVPKSAIDGDLSAMEIAPVVAPFDGTNGDNLRTIEASAGSYTFGGGTSGADTRVIDAVTPTGTTVGEVVDTGTIPYVSLTDGTTIAAYDDATGDDAGPGGYTYPTGPSDVYRDGTFDITGVTIREADARYYVDVTLADLNASGYADGATAANGFELQTVGIYLRDPTESGGTTAGRTGTNLTFEQPYHYRIHAEGFAGQSVAEDASGNPLPGTLSVGADGDTISVGIPRRAIDGDIRGMEAAVLLFAQAGGQTGRVRQVAASNGQYTFGGGRDDDMDPNAIDMLDPAGIDQSAALAYDASTRATVPFFRIEAGPTVVSAPATDPDGDGRYEDVDGDGTADRDDALALFEHRHDDAVADSGALFDFNDSGRFELADVLRLVGEVGN